MTSFMHAVTIVTLQGQGLTLHGILADIPHDAAAFVIYALSIVSIVWVFKAGLKKPPNDGPTDD